MVKSTELCDFKALDEKHDGHWDRCGINLGIRTIVTKKRFKSGRKPVMNNSNKKGNQYYAVYRNERHAE